MNELGAYRDEKSIESGGCRAEQSSSVWSDELCSVWRERRKSVVAVSGAMDTGSGVVIDRHNLPIAESHLPQMNLADGDQLVLTAAHLVDKKSNILVGAFDEQGRMHHMDQARLLRSDPVKDLALLAVKFSRKPDLEPIAAESFQAAQPGQKALAVRTDETTRSLAVFSVSENSSFGTVGGEAIRTVDHTVKLGDATRVVVLSTADQPGTSGSPLISESGKIVGIVSQRLPRLDRTAHGLKWNSQSPWISSAAVSTEEIRDFLKGVK